MICLTTERTVQPDILEPIHVGICIDCYCHPKIVILLLYLLLLLLLLILLLSTTLCVEYGGAPESAVRRAVCP